jgi:hypothetical protein
MLASKVAANADEPKAMTAAAAVARAENLKVFFIKLPKVKKLKMAVLLTAYRAR